MVEAEGQVSTDPAGKVPAPANTIVQNSGIVPALFSSTGGALFGRAGRHGSGPRVGPICVPFHFAEFPMGAAHGTLPCVYGVPQTPEWRVCVLQTPEWHLCDL